MPHSRSAPRPVLAAAIAVAAVTAAGALAVGRPATAAPRPATLPQDPVGPGASAAWLALLPDGEEKRRFILDCTGCHVFDARIARPGGAARAHADWESWTARMLGFAGATTAFPVIAHDRDAAATAAWLSRHVGAPAAAPTAALPPAAAVRTDPAGRVTEYMIPEAADLPHDVAVDAGGTVIVTGMMTGRMYTLTPGAAAFDVVPLEVPRANPRAVELGPDGAWWVLFGAPRQMARRDAATGAWRHFPIGMYPHSVALDSSGGVWFNGHFTRDPEQLGRLDPATGATELFDVPPHPTMAKVPGGPIPYELRAAPDGRIWMSELQGNRIVAFDPRTKAFRAWPLPTSWSGPRRFDIGPDGVLWIPAYSANLLVRFDPRTERFEEIPLPLRDAVPYVARVDQATGRVWLGTAAADAVLAYDPATREFTSYPLPTQGALIRHMVVHPATRSVWVAYGASPGIPARIARVEYGAR